MDKQSKIFFLVFFLLIAGSVAVTYYRYVVARDYLIQAEMECDPYTEACFVYVCDPEAEECTGDPVEDTSYYKLITRNAKNIPLCDPAEEGCEALTCPAGEAECEIMYCDPEEEEEGTCIDPLIYTLENPLEDEELSEESAEASDTAEEDEVNLMENEAMEEPADFNKTAPQDQDAVILQ